MAGGVGARDMRTSAADDHSGFVIFIYVSTDRRDTYVLLYLYSRVTALLFFYIMTLRPFRGIIYIAAAAAVAVRSMLRLRARVFVDRAGGPAVRTLK